MLPAFRACFMWWLFSGPTGSSAVRSNFGSVDLKANKFIIISPPHSQLLAKPMQRRMVGSSSCSSAVEGFNPMKTALGSPWFQVLESEYLNVRHFDSIASF